MAQDHTYLLRIWRSRAVSGEQWAARLDHLPDGETCRFRDPEALLAHLRAVLWASDPPTGSPDRPAGPDEPAPEPHK